MVFVSTGKHLLLRDGQLIPLRAKPFELLLALIENQGRAMSKEELVNRVWPGSVVSDGNFHVNLDAVRKALSESGREPHFILRTAGGYKFVADVREVTEVREQKADIVSMRDSSVPNKHVAHVIITGSLYGAMYAIAVLLEVAYQFDRFGRMALWVAPTVLVWMAVTSAGGLMIDRNWTSRNGMSGLGASVLTLLVAAALLFGALTLFLPLSRLPNQLYRLIQRRRLT
jgi:DNA-binding winged helix-turn-helix (wHTH) protein